MNCSDVMSDPPLLLRRDDKVADALKKMLEARLTSVPVADAKGRYIGMFRVRRVIGLTLPKAATVDHLVDDISFIHEDLADLTRHLDTVRDNPVSKHLDETVPSL
ncbi:MAG: CBS domain-containing protein, partial [Candidatus Eiseniibacteriota bacterium]